MEWQVGNWALFLEVITESRARHLQNIQGKNSYANLMRLDAISAQYFQHKAIKRKSRFIYIIN